MGALALLVAAGALLGALGVLATVRVARARSRRAAARDVAVHGALGDAVLVLDARGRVVAANERAERLAGAGPGGLAGAEVGRLGEDLRILARGLARGPASGTVALGAGAGAARARAALARVRAFPAHDLVVLRAETPPPHPPPLPAPRRATPPPDPAEARAGLAAAAAAVRAPLAHAARAASLLRLSAPSLEGRPAAALAALEAALEEAERRVGALAVASHPGARRSLDLAALVDDVARAVQAPPGVRVRAEVAPARVLADDRALRAALREVLRCAAAPLAPGEELVAAVGADGPAPSVVVSAPGAAGAAVAALARALLAPHGGCVEELPARADAWRVRLVLPAAGAEAPAEARAPA